MSTPRILVAEDDPVSRKIALAQLAKLGYAADSVPSGAEAVAAMQGQPYDLILMDCQLPGMDGLEATAKIRQLESHGRRAKIIAVTSSSPGCSPEDCVSAGMDGYLEKPISTEELEECLRARLNSDEEATVLNDAGYAVLDPESIQALRDEGDNLLEELIAIFERENLQRLEMLRQALEDKDFKTAERVAHTVKSTAGTFGAKRLQTISRELENSFRNGEKVDTLKVAAFRTECKRVERALRSEIEHQSAAPMLSPS